MEFGVLSVRPHIVYHRRCRHASSSRRNKCGRCGNNSDSGSICSNIGYGGKTSRGLIINPGSSNQQILENYFPGKSKEEKELLIEFIHTSYYSKGEITFVTPHERLLYYTTQDSGECFASILGYANIHLLNPDIEALLQKYQEVNASKGDSKSKSSDNQSICKTSFILAKKYTEIEDLLEDNGNVIYFDKQYDKTYYTAKDIYSSEKSKMSAEQFTSFLEKSTC